MQSASGKIQKKFILYDGRACNGGDTEDAQILCVASSLKEARNDSKMFGDGAIYAVDVDFSTTPGKTIGEEVWIEDFGTKQP